jgi:tetratricopeptide (TPR) repeat protein
MAEVAFRDYLNEIDNLIEHGSLDQATQHCRHLLAQHPKAVEVYRLLGKVLLEQEEDRAAQDVFQRVLSVDPEDFVARVGLSIIHDRNNEVEPAIWHMERAFEIAPSNPLIQGELRRLYARRDGDAPDRIPLTRGALARMYAAGDLNTEAITDLKQLLAEQTERLDLQVQLAEVLWRDEQRVEAAERILQITATLPYCLKANLILGAIWRASEANGESDEPLQRAQAVDPENDFADRLFSGLGPLYRQVVMVDHLELQTVDQMLEAPLPLAEAEEIPDWLRGLSDLEQPLLEEPESMQAARLGPGVHMPDVATEVPEWLQGLTGEAPAAAEAEVPNWLAALTGAAVAGAAADALTDRKAVPEEVVITPSEEPVPDWIAQLSQTGKLKAEELPPQEDEPDWLAQLREQPPAPFSEQVPSQADTETPDWLAQLQASETSLESETVTSEQPDWLADLREQPPAPFSAQVSDQADTETPDWLAQLRASSSEVETPAEEDHGLGVGAAVAGLAGLTAAGIAAVAGRDEEAEPETAPVPEQPIDLAVPPGAPVAEAEPALSFAMPAEPEVPEEMPSADDALAFLAKLAAGKEDQLRAQAQEEADVRMAEIMGRKPEAKPAEEKPGVGLAAGVALGAAAVAGLAAARQEEPVATPPVVEMPAAAPAAEVPAEMPSADDALAFLSRLAAGKEDQLRAQAEQEAESRMAEIMGRKPAEAAPPAEDKQAPIKMTVPAATVAAVAAGLAAKSTKPEEKLTEPTAPAVAPAAEVPAEMPSADDALAFLARLAAGKEDQLRAEAEQEAEERMAAIMGRKVEEKPAEEKPGVGLPAAAVGVAALVGVLAAQKEEPPTPPVTETPAVPEEMPSSDDALAFLSRLAAGKEDQLRAQAEEEAEARMAAIMGRAPVEPANPIEVAAAPAAVIEPEPEIEIAESVAEAELPDWLKAMRPTEDAAAETPESELPEWLRAMRPSEDSTEVGLTALIEEEQTIEATPDDELPDWLRAAQPVATAFEEPSAAIETPPTLGTAEAAVALGLLATAAQQQPDEVADEELATEDLLAELTALEQAAAQAGVLSAEAPAAAHTAALLPMDWWTQSAADTDELVLAELPEPYLSPRARAAEKEKAAAAAIPAPDAKPVERKLPQTGPLRQTGPLSLPQTNPLSTPAPVPQSPEVETLLSRVYQDEEDFAARLDLARTYWATGNREGAYTEYLALVNAGEFTKETMADLETIVDVHDQTDWHRMLGDVYMKAGRLSSALDQYRRALNEV